MDAVEIVASASGLSSAGDSATGLSSVVSYSNSDHVTIVQNESGSPSVGPSSLVRAPLSPQRSTQSVPSPPSSVQRRLEATPQSVSASPMPRRTGDPVPQPQPLPQIESPTLEFGGHAVLLGLQQLEQQQIPRQYTPDHSRGQYQHGFSDDERTEPSSSATGNTGENPAGYTRSDLAATSTFGRLIQTSRVSNCKSVLYFRSNTFDAIRGQ
jgi:hypothetical protein